MGQVSGNNITIGVEDGNVTVNGANLVASVTAFNGTSHVIDVVILHPTN
jgi:uncharacterized surface protein with fasciclin (FAS1) repeats